MVATSVAVNGVSRPNAVKAAKANATPCLPRIVITIFDMVSFMVAILNFEFSACGIGWIRQVGEALERSAIGFRGMVRSGMVRWGIVRSGMVRGFGWADGAEAADGAFSALGALGADCAEGAFGALAADCAEAALGALGAESAEGALPVDCFACAALVAGCAGSPRGTPL